MSIIFTVDYASNVPVKINEYKCWLFLIIFQTWQWQWQWPTRKPRLLWPLFTSSLSILFIDICILYFWKKIIYSVCVRVIHLNSANKVEVARLQHICLIDLATRVFSFHIIRAIEICSVCQLGQLSTRAPSGSPQARSVTRFLLIWGANIISLS